MAQSQSQFREHIRVAMVDNSRYTAIAGTPMPADMVEEMENSMARLSDPIWDMVAGWALGLEGDEFPDERVRMSINDPLTGYLADKIDDDTIKYDLSTFKLYVNNIPLATDITVGGVMVGSQPYLYMQGYQLMANVETSQLLVGGNDMIPTSRAVKLYVDSVVTGGGGGGDMLKSTYDTDNNGVVDDSERLGNQLPAYYLAWANFTGVPTTISGYGITDAYTETEIDAFFEGEDTGKKQVDWARVTNKPNLYTVHNNVDNRVLTGGGAYDIYAEPNLTFNGTDLTVATGGKVYADSYYRTGVNNTSIRFVDQEEEVIQIYVNHVTTRVMEIWDSVVIIESVAILNAKGAVTFDGLGSDDDEDHIIAIDDITGILSKRSVSSIGSGDVTKVGTPVDNQIGVWTGDGTLEGDVNFTWTGTVLKVGSPSWTLSTVSTGATYNYVVNSGGSGYYLEFSSGTSSSTTGSHRGGHLFFHAGDQIGTGGGDGGNIYIDAGNSVSGNHGDIYLGYSSTERGLNNIYIGDGTVTAYLPTKVSETNVVYYNTTTGQLVYGVISEGVTLSGSTNNTICTVTGADAIQGEANLTFDGTNLSFNLGSNQSIIVASEATGVGNALSITAGETTDDGQLGGGLYLRGGDGTDADGSVFIGQDAAGDKAVGAYINMVSSAGTKLRITSTGSIQDVSIYFRQDTTSLGMIGWDDSADVLKFQYGSAFNTFGIGINSTNDVGIGVNPSTTYKLYTYSDISGGYAGYFFNDGNNVDRYGLRIDAGADTQTTGTHYYIRAYTGDGTIAGYLNNINGTFQVTDASDKRRKENIVNTNIDTVKILMALKVRDFHWKNMPGILKTGWVAQEVAKVYPAMHMYDKDEDLHSIASREIIPVLHRGWQLHEERIETVEEKIIRLETRVRTLEVEIEKGNILFGPG